MRTALRDINKKGVEIGERQNRCHDDMYVLRVRKDVCGRVCVCVLEIEKHVWLSETMIENKYL